MKKKEIKKTIIPRGKYVLVLPDPEEPKESEFGIITPSNVEQEKKSTGTVLGVGKLVDDLKKGDKVIFGTYAGERVTLNKVEYVVADEGDLIAWLQ